MKLKPIVYNTLFEDVQKLWKTNQRLRAYTYMILHGLASYIALFIQEDPNVSIIFGVAINAIVYDLSKMIEQNNGQTRKNN